MMRLAVCAGLGLAVLGSTTVRAQYYSQPRSYENGQRRFEERQRDERREPEQERFRGPAPYRQGEVRALQQQRNQRVLSLEQSYNSGRITRGQLAAGTHDADRSLAARTGR